MKKSRELVVSRTETGRALSVVLCGRLGLDWNSVRPLIEAGRVRINGSVCRDPARRVAAGHKLQLVAAPGRRDNPAPRKPPAPSQSRAGQKPAGPVPVLRFADGVVVVVDKPEGLTTMRHAHEAAEFGSRARKYLPDTLADLLPAMLDSKKGRVRAVHRLDRDTSGLVVFARTPDGEKSLSEQFRKHTVGRRYLALVRGRAASGTVASHIVRDRGDGRRGTSPSGDGKHAVTHVKVVEELGDFTLVECTLETGRTHQVRIHLGEQGTPICGERIYDRPLHGQPVPDESGCQRLALHAAYLAFDHPKTGKRLHWSSPLPRELERVVKELRKRK
ncbi:MAG: pseudouridine synthase [Gemmataceae bacterium]